MSDSENEISEMDDAGDFPSTTADGRLPSTGEMWKMLQELKQQTTEKEEKMEKKINDLKSENGIMKFELNEIKRKGNMWLFEFAMMKSEHKKLLKQRKPHELIHDGNDEDEDRATCQLHEVVNEEITTKLLENKAENSGAESADDEEIKINTRIWRNIVSALKNAVKVVQFVGDVATKIVSACDKILEVNNSDLEMETVFSLGILRWLAKKQEQITTKLACIVLHQASRLTLSK